MNATERKQCPFCLARVRLRASGEFYEHKMSWGKVCNGSRRTPKDAKEHRRAGAPMAAQETKAAPAGALF